MAERGSRKRKRNSSEVSKTLKGIFRKDDLDDSLSTSDWGPLIDDSNKTKRISNSVKMIDEPLNMVCEWRSCGHKFTSYAAFQDHLKQYFQDIDVKDEDIFRCFWKNCTYTATSALTVNDHISYHGYHAKLISVGRNVELRTPNLPKCTQQDQFTFPESSGFKCDWEDCFKVCMTLYDFFNHVQLHVYHGPKGGKHGTINCKWKGCTFASFVSQYKLNEHLRRHTRERIVACPTCGHLFGTKTKFCDHLKRQLPPELQSYLCSQCSKYFPTERLLRDHMRMHINLYKCSMCEMTCPKPSILAKHIRYRHLTERPYKCDQCNYSCVAKHNLDLHLRKHDPDSQFKCEDCEFECRSAYGLERHVHLSHGKGRNNIYECHICKKQFNRGGLLTRHLRKAHDVYWPSGHSRFRYKEDPDGLFRVQTVRYETLDVTEEIIKGKTVCAPSDKEPLQFDLLVTEPENNSVHRFDVVLCSGKKQEKTKKPKKRNTKSPKKVVITIDDVDSEGKVVQSEMVLPELIIANPDKDATSKKTSDE